MILALIIFASVIAGLLVYGTGAIATFHVLDRLLWGVGDCECDPGKRSHTTSYGSIYMCTNFRHLMLPGMGALVWPVCLVLVPLAIIGLIKPAVFLAKGPTRWGNALADLPRRRELRQENKANEAKALQSRIKELEAELEAEGVLTSV